MSEALKRLKNFRAKYIKNAVETATVEVSGIASEVKIIKLSSEKSETQAKQEAFADRKKFEVENREVKEAGNKIEQFQQND